MRAGLTRAEAAAAADAQLPLKLCGISYRLARLAAAAATARVLNLGHLTSLHGDHRPASTG